MKNLRFLKYVGFAILGIGFVTLAIFVTMSLWNWLVPLLFHGPVLTFWQTAGLFILSKILLSGMAPHHGRNRKYGRDWRYKYNEKHGWCRPEERTEPTTEKAF
jgi:hypothetical protein